MDFEKILADILAQTNATKAAAEKQVEEATSRYKQLEERIKEMEKGFSVSNSKAVSIPGLELEKDKFSIVRAVGAMLTGDWKDAGFEKEVFDNVKKAMNAGSNVDGGYIVPIQVLPDFIELIRARAVVVSMGVTELNNLVGSPIEIPMQTGGSTAYWTGENDTIQETAITFGQKQMTPRGIAALVKISNKLIRMANPSIEAMVRRDLAASLALKIDLALLRGDGQANTPVGIANIPGVQTYNPGAGGNTSYRASYIDMDNMVGALEDENLLYGKLGFIFNPKVKRLMKQERIAEYNGDTKGEYTMLPITDAKFAEFLGYQFATSTQVPANLTASGDAYATASEIYFGNFEEALLGSWGGMEIVASNVAGTAFEKNQTHIRVTQEVDVAIRHAKSFVVSNTARTTP